MTSLKNDNTLVEILLKDLGCRIHRLLSAIHLFHAVLSAVSAILENGNALPGDRIHKKSGPDASLLYGEFSLAVRFVSCKIENLFGKTDSKQVLHL